MFQNNMAQRFRSNFVIGGSIEVLEELTWKRIYIGNLCFEVKMKFLLLIRYLHTYVCVYNVTIISEVGTKQPDFKDVLQKTDSTVVRR